MTGRLPSPQGRIGARVLVAALVTGLLAVLVATPAAAHRGEQSYLYLDVAPEDLAGRVEMPYLDIEEAFELDLSGPAGEVRIELEEAYPTLIDYLLDHTAVGADGETWDLAFTGEVLLLSEEEGDTDDPNYAIFPFEIERPAGPVPRVLDITFDPFFDELDDRDSIVLVANDWRRGVYDAEANELRVFTPSSRSGSIDLGDPSQWRNFTGSTQLGVDHIRTGPDHVFFILALLLPSVLVFAAGWRPAPTFGAALWRVIKLASMFTLAHTITFTVAGLQLIPLPPSQLTETIIALSIAAAALHNLRPVFLNREWLLAFLFGLFHGLGFASLVESLDVDRTTQLVSLIGRNLGIEIGQVIVILVAFPALFLMRRTRYYSPLFIAGSLALAAVSLVWAVERIVGADYGISRWVELALKWPRSLIVMVVVTAAAWVIHQAEDRAGRLLAVDSGDPGVDTGETPAADQITVSKR